MLAVSISLLLCFMHLDSMLYRLVVHVGRSRIPPRTTGGHGSGMRLGWIHTSLSELLETGYWRLPLSPHEAAQVLVESMHPALGDRPAKTYGYIASKPDEVYRRHRVSARRSMDPCRSRSIPRSLRPSSRTPRRRHASPVTSTILSPSTVLSSSKKLPSRSKKWLWRDAQVRSLSMHTRLQGQDVRRR